MSGFLGEMLMFDANMKGDVGFMFLPVLYVNCGKGRGLMLLYVFILFLSF